MTREDQISSIAGRLGVKLAARPTVSPEELSTYHLIVDRSSPSSKIRALQSALVQEGITLRISYYGEDQDAFKSAIRESLRQRFEIDVGDITISKSGGVYRIVVICRGCAAEVSGEIESHIAAIRRLFDNPLISLQIETDSDKPTATEFLVIARRKAPITCEVMQQELHDRGYSTISLEWINHQFDRLRKGAFLHRQPDRTYVLTQGGLMTLGSGKGRGSPDVARLLDLARRRN